MTACICIIIASILLLIYSIYQATVVAPRRKAVDQHHKLSWKLTNSGSETSSLKRAVACHSQLSASYAEIRDFVNANAKSCYEDDIELIRDNAEVLAQDAWYQKAQSYLVKMTEAHALIVHHNFTNIEKAYSSKTTFLKAYDAYFDWTRKCYEDSRSIWKNVNLWDEAKKQIMNMLGEAGGYVYWTSPEYGRTSVRQQIDVNLTKHIESMRPEYLRKTKLKSLILQKIADCGSIQRSLLLKSSFDGFVEAEIQACYKGLVKEHSIIEVKQGSVYFSSLSDKEAKKHPPKPDKSAPKAEKTMKKQEDRRMIAPMTKVLYRELIRHFDEEGIEYVDKTATGGSLYFFGEKEAESLKSKGYPVYYAEKGTKGTGHRPAWYIKFTK